MGSGTSTFLSLAPWPLSIAPHSMNKFDAKAVSDKEATAIAGYILKTFK